MQYNSIDFIKLPDMGPYIIKLTVKISKDETSVIRNIYNV